jgi:hypothetical protein
MGAVDRKRQKRIKEYVVERDGSICCYCDKVLTDELVTLDHIVPDSKRGSFNTTNLTISCADCNNRRGNVPFFEYCKRYNWPEEKIDKYKKLYFANLRIKVLNIAKEECLKGEWAVPNVLLKKASHIMRIKPMDFSDCEREYTLNIKFGELSFHRDIKCCFVELIRILEAESR